MDLATLTNTLKSGGGISNPIASLTSSLGTKVTSLSGSSVPEIAALGTALGGVSTSATNAVTGITNSIMTKLPLMKAADGLASKLSSSLGTQVPSGGAAFNDAFSPITSSETQLTSLQNALTPSVMASLEAGETTHVASLSSLISTASSTISSAVSASTAGISDSISTLKSFAFAKFTSMNHPPHIQNILDKVMTTPVAFETARKFPITASSITSPVSADRLPSVSVASLKETKPSQVNKTSIISTNLASIGYTGADAFKNFSNDFDTYLEGLSSQASAVYKSMNLAEDACLSWRETNIPNYTALKQAALNNPNDANAQTAYNNAKTNYDTTGGYAAFRAQFDDYIIKRNNVLRLRALWDNWMATDFAGVTAGPTW